MVQQSSLLVALVDVIDLLPSPPVTRRDGPLGGRPPVYSDRLFLKALVIMLVRKVSTVSGLIAILEQPTWEMQMLRTRLTEHGRFPVDAPGSVGWRRCRAACRRGSGAWVGIWSG